MEDTDHLTDKTDKIRTDISTDILTDMARLTQVPIAPPRRDATNSDFLTDLNRLLDRLQQTILHADAEREKRLRTSEYERTKARIVRLDRHIYD